MTDLLVGTDAVSANRFLQSLAAAATEGAGASSRQPCSLHQICDRKGVGQILLVEIDDLTGV
eukprot:525773-Pleurochrysis_carterae.AAC.2